MIDMRVNRMTWLGRPKALVSAVLFARCGRSRGVPRPKPAAAAQGTPSVTWVVMSGDRENPDRDFVCQSNSPGDCVVPVSRPDEQIFSDVHLYYHGADTDIKYVGAIRIGLFRGASCNETIQK